MIRWFLTGYLVLALLAPLLAQCQKRTHFKSIRTDSEASSSNSQDLVANNREINKAQKAKKSLEDTKQEEDSALDKSIQAITYISSTHRDIDHEVLEDTTSTIPELNELLEQSLELIFQTHDSENVSELIKVEAGKVFYTPKLNYFGQQIISYKAKTNNFVKFYGDIKLNIKPVNDSPIAKDAIAQGIEDFVLMDDFPKGTDVEGSSLVYSISDEYDLQSGQFKIIDPNTGTYTFTPRENFNGNVSILYKVFDGESFSKPATLKIDILPQNDNPIVLGKKYTILENTTLKAVLDPPANPDMLANLSYKVISPPSHGTLEFKSDGSFNYTPEINNAQNVTFSYVVANETITSNEAMVEIQITPVNKNPISKNASYTTYKNQSISVSLFGNDPENDPLTYHISLMPEKGTLEISGDLSNKVTYVPSLNYSGADRFKYYTEDSKGNRSNISDIRIEVLKRTLLISDSFERKKLLDTEVADSNKFAWTAIVDENGKEMNEVIECEGKGVHICAVILNKELYNLGEMAHGKNAFFFFGRQGHSEHDLWLHSKQFDLSLYSSAQLSFDWLPFDLNDDDNPNDKQTEFDEYFRVEVCVKNSDVCELEFSKPETWAVVFDSKGLGYDDNSLNGKNHKKEDWIKTDISLDFKSIVARNPDFDKSNFILRFKARMQDGFRNNLPSTNEIMDAVALDNVVLTAE